MRALAASFSPATLGPGSLAILLVIGGVFVVASLVRGVAVWRRPDETTRGLWRRLGTWWFFFLALVTMLALGRPAIVVTMAAISLLGLREGLELTGWRPAYPLLALLAGGLYVWAWLAWRSLFLLAMPALAAALLLGEVAWRIARRPPRRADRREPRTSPPSVDAGGGRSVRAGVRDAVLAALVAVIGPSFVVAVASLREPVAAPGEPLGPVVLLFVLTELNDMAQAWWGRAMGAHKMAPRLSPNKSWEGLAGGLATTLLAAVVLCPVVTGYGRHAAALGGAGGVPGPPWVGSLGIGLVVALAGVAGDLSVSALKRRAGTKDSGRLLPGHGGVLDRFDSLALSAPAFFLVTWLVWSPGS